MRRLKRLIFLSLSLVLFSALPAWPQQASDAGNTVAAATQSASGEQAPTNASDTSAASAASGPGVASDTNTLPPIPASEAERTYIVHQVVVFSFAFVGIGLALLILVAWLVRAMFWKSAAQQGPAKWRTYLLQLPLGAPEGSVRAVLSLFVIVFGFIVIALQGYLGLGNMTAIAGFVGSVITFYFTSRSNEQMRKSAQQTQDSLTSAVTQAATALQTTTSNAAQSQHDLIRQAAAQNTSVVNAALDSMAHVASSAAAGDASAGIVTPPAGASGGELTAASNELKDIQLVTRGVIALGAGADSLPDVQKTLASSSELLAQISPMLASKAAPASTASVLQDVRQKLPAIRAGALPGVLAEAGQVLVDTGTPILAGLPGGPIGIAGGVLIAATHLASDAPKLARLKAALLNQPFDPDLIPDTADPNVAEAALDRAPLMKAHYAGAEPSTVLNLMKLAITKQNGLHMNAADLADACASDVGAAKTSRLPQPTDAFVTLNDLQQAFDEYLAALIHNNAANQLTDTIPIPSALVGAPAGGASINLPTLLSSVASSVTSPATAAQVERLTSLGEAIGKLPIDSSKAVALVSDALRVAADGGLVETRTTEK